MKSSVTISLFLLILCLQGYAQDNLSNRWKETARTDRRQQPVAFKDTMRLADVTKDSVKMRRGSFLYPGTINNDLLDMGYQQFQIIKADANEMRIGDDTYIHILTREAKAADAVGISNSMQEMALPAAPVTVVDTGLLTGTWEAYNRRKKAGTTGSINYKTLIKTATFSSRQGKLTGTMSISSGNTAPLYTIDKPDKGKLIVVAADKTTHTFTVWKQAKEELIIEDEDGILYYMKKF